MYEIKENDCQWNKTKTIDFFLDGGIFCAVVEEDQEKGSICFFGEDQGR